MRQNRGGWFSTLGRPLAGLVLALSWLPGGDAVRNLAAATSLQADLVGDGQPAAAPAITSFVDSYLSGGQRYMIHGFEPSGSGASNPLYILVGGFADQVHENYSTLRFAREMANRGYVAATIETPGMAFITHEPNETATRHELEILHNDDLQMRCDASANRSLTSIARRIFSYGASDRGESNPLGVLCRRARADCTAGVAIHGISLGGLLSRLAPRFAPRWISAMLVYSAGTIVPGGRQCCGAISSNMTCCPPPDATDGFLSVGGVAMGCQMSVSVSEHLPQSKRRVVIGAEDFYYGDCDCPDLDGDRACTCRHGSPYGAVAQAQLSSGYTCAHRRECVQPDGSGFYVPSLEEVGTDSEMRYQGHMFYGDCRGRSREDNERDGCALSEEFLSTDAPWGLRSSFDWLAAAARR